jgi:hypothetical protein
MTVVICAIFRNEAPYLREWIEFHRMVGVERFYLYQNLSDDDWEPALRPYIGAGIVEVTDWPRSPPGQLHAYQHFIDRHKGKAWWTAFIDCDEFLFSPTHATVTEALAGVASPQWGAVGVNWMCFGASGRIRRTKGLVTERFTIRPSDNFSPNLHIKSIVRMDRVEWVARNPHCFIVNGGTFDELGREVPGAFTATPTHRSLRIHHYHTKSHQEYMKRIARGRGGGGPPRSPGEFDLYQSPDVDDKIMSRFLPELKRRLAAPEPKIPPYDVLYDSRGAVHPVVSIVTTVYNRVACLKRCIESVQALRFENYEHIIVADSPSPSALKKIQALVKRLDDGRHRLRLAVLHQRANDWGITPASAGLSLAAGTYVSFLSDDNGYTPDHFERLVAALRKNPDVGFAYSGCHYGGRGTLSFAPPAYNQIDLGQPLFRRELFNRHLGGTLPFDEPAWDWRMIGFFMNKGVRWKHVRATTFIFRLAKYPHLIALRPVRASSTNPRTSHPSADSQRKAAR